MMTLLVSLGDILLSEGYGYEFAENEEAYVEAMKKIGKRVIGFRQNPGYISFDPAYMCDLIAQWMEEDDVSVICLEKMLRYHQLAYVSGNGDRLKCRWNTKGSYCHVHLRKLIEFVNGTEDDEYILIQEYIERFEQSFVTAF